MPEYEHSSWNDAIANVNAGNIALSDNTIFKFWDFYVYAGENWDTKIFPMPGSEVIFDIENARVNDERYVAFRDGSKYGMTLTVKPDYDNQTAGSIQTWFQRGGDFTSENTLQTAAGTPVCWIGSQSLPRYVDLSREDPITGETITLHLMPTTIRLAIAYYHWGSSGAPEPPPMEYIYMSAGRSQASATGGMFRYEHQYGENDAVPWATYGDIFSSGLTGYNWVDFLASNSAEPVNYPGDDYSYYGGGDGTYSDVGAAVVPMPGVPSIQTIDLGFTQLYNPSINDVKAMSNWLWSDDFDQNIMKNYTSPFENIVSLGLVPLHINADQDTLVIGNVNSHIGMPKVTDQYIEDFSCGTIYVPGYWRAFMDFDCVNYTIWLPYVGFRSIKASEVIDCNLKVSYNIDLLTGNAVCCILNDKYFDDFTVLYAYNCNILQTLPISGANFMAQYNQELAATVAGNQNFMSMAGNAMGAIGNLSIGNIGGAINNVFGMVGANDQQKLADRQMQTAKPEYGRGGNFGGTNGNFATRYPYLIKSRPDTKVPKDYAKYEGIPAFARDNLSNLTGYTEVYAINIDIDCTATEKQEIAQLLSSGVYL